MNTVTPFRATDSAQGVKFPDEQNAAYFEARARAHDGLWWDPHDGLAFSDVLSGKQPTHTVPVEPHLTLDLDFSQVGRGK